MVGRSRDCATSAELGQDVQPEVEEAPPEPEHPHQIERQQVPEDADRYPGYPYETCLVCGVSGRIGSVDPFEECEEHSERERIQESDTEVAKSSVSIERQMVFSENGGLEPEAGSVETSLEAFGADVDHRERETQIDRPAASEFGVDDRPEVVRAKSGEQGALFASVEEDQVTLAGERAAGQSLF